MQNLHDNVSKQVQMLPAKINFVNKDSRFPLTFWEHLFKVAAFDKDVFILNIIMNRVCVAQNRSWLVR